MERRDFVKLMALAPGAMAASWHMDFAREKLISQIDPEAGEVPPDQTVIFHSICGECPAGCGLRVKVRRGHPFKLEGDPEGHPGNGGLCVRGQAALARLYHPARLRTPLRKEAGEFRPASWDEALAAVDAALTAAAAQGARSFYLAGRTTGVTADLIDELGRRRGVTRLPELELLYPGAVARANELVFGRAAIPSYRFERAELLVTIGADLFEGFPDPVRNMGACAAHQGDWLHIEPGLSLTGCRAGRRWVVPSGSEVALLACLLREVGGVPGDVAWALPEVDLGAAARATGLEAAAIETLARDLRSRRALVVCGGLTTAREDGLTAAVLTALLQAATGELGETVDFDRPQAWGGVQDLGRLAEAIAALGGGGAGVAILARVHSLLGVSGARELLSRASLRVGLTDFLTAPMADCDWLLPLSLPLESPVDGLTISGARVRHRPVFRPLFDTRTEGEVLLALLGETRTFEEVAAAWSEPVDAAGDLPLEVHAGETARLLSQAPGFSPASGITLLVPAAARGFDGRSRPITLLHEIPDALSAVSYGDVVWVAAADAERWGAETGDLLELSVPNGTLRLPALVHPAQPAGVIAVMLDALVAENDWAPVTDAATGEWRRCLGGVGVQRTGERRPPAVLAGSMEAFGFGILPGDAPHPAPAGEAHAEPAGHGEVGAHGDGDPVITLFKPNPRTSDIRWAMAVDLDRCTGCSACVAACYVENNIPATGADEHHKGRELSWLRVQPYLRRDGGVRFVPMMCQHCDYAPCETVCPVYATYHNPDGLNAQVYNRCVGTRYCANNCPYKMRRFNWFSIEREAPLDLMLNPDVSVRPKGVMEKCTFCIQRIRAAKDLAKDEERGLRDGDVIPACAESCPAQAIVFGNLLDPHSRVHALAHSKRAYRVLADLGTGPAVYYLSEEQAHES